MELRATLGWVAMLALLTQGILAASVGLRLQDSSQSSNDNSHSSIYRYNRPEKSYDRTTDVNGLIYPRGRRNFDKTEDISLYNVKREIPVVSAKIELPLEKPDHVDEGSEDVDPLTGVIHGKYSYLEEDGIPATFEYEANPEGGFKITSYIKGSKQLPAPRLERAIQSQISPSTNKEVPINDDEKVSKEIKTQSLKVMEDIPNYGHSRILARYQPKVTRKSRFASYDQPIKTQGTIKNGDPLNDQTNIKEPTIPQADITTEKKLPVFDASYRFGFTADDQSRNEEADANGDIHGSYSYIGDDGLLTKVEYEAGAEKGFIVKNVAQEKTKPIGVSGHPIGIKSSIQSPSALNKHGPFSLFYSINTGVPYTDISDKLIHQPNTSNQKDLPVLGTTLDDEIETENDEVNGSYSFSYETPEQSRQEMADEKGKVQGQYSFVPKDDGNRRKIEYLADSENGFVAKGVHLPSAPSTELELPSAEGIPKINEDGSYSFSFKTSDQSREESADSRGNVKGKFSFVPHDTQKMQEVSYEASADKGFSVQSQHLPLAEDGLLPKKPIVILQGQNEGPYSYSKETSDQSSKAMVDDVTGGVIEKDSSDINEEVKLTVNNKNEASLSKGYDTKEVDLPLIDDTTDKQQEVQYEDSTDTSVPVNEDSVSKGGETLPNGKIDKASLENENKFSSQDKSDYLNDDYQSDTVQKDDNSFYIRYVPYIPREFNVEDKNLLESSVGFITNGASVPNHYSPQVILDLAGIRRAVAEREGNHPTPLFIRKVIKKCPGCLTYRRPLSPDFSRVLPDGSYAFSYKTNDQIREEAVDSLGNVHSQYEYETANDGKTIVIFTRKAQPLANTPVDTRQSYNFYQTPKYLNSQPPDRRRHTKKQEIIQFTADKTDLTKKTNPEILLGTPLYKKPTYMTLEQQQGPVVSTSHRLSSLNTNKPEKINIGEAQVKPTVEVKPSSLKAFRGNTKFKMLSPLSDRENW